jgi:putative restriction endonuclease
MMFADDTDRRVRVAAFQWLTAQKSLHGQILSRDLLARGFQFEDRRVPIVGPSGIFKPAVLPEVPLSITTIPGGPYDDDLRDGGSVIHYRYRGTDPNHRDNVGLRRAYREQIPLIFCYCAMPGRYTVSFPVFICGDHPQALTFDVQLDDDIALGRYLKADVVNEPEELPNLRRQYVTVSAKRRLHQAAFRERVLAAYEVRCALCRLRHGSLLDAAHIIPDGEPEGDPVVSNGLSLCKLHHAAFDQNFLGIRPDFKVEIRAALLTEIDGPMLKHGLNAMHGEKIFIPRSAGNRPSVTLLERRFDRFREATRED